MHPVDLIPPSKTLEVDSLAKKLIAEKKDVVNLTTGEPDFPTPIPIVEKAIEALNGGFTKYTDSNGILELRQAISKYLSEKKGVNFSADQIVVSNGGKQALYNAFRSIVKEGDEVILFAPLWVSYAPQIQMCGGVPKIIQTKFEDNFEPKIEEIEKNITETTVAIVVNSPSNPTGSIYKKETLEAIADLANRKGLFVISDEVYDDLVYEGKHITMQGLVKDEFLIYINAFSKSHAMTGWRIGWSATKNEKVKKRISKIQGHLASNINSITQKAGVAACSTDNSYMVEEFKKRRDFVIQKAEEIGLRYVKPQGAFYLFFETPYDDNEFCKKLLEEKLVAIVPGSAFEAQNFARLSFANSLENLEKGFRKLKEFLGK